MKRKHIVAILNILGILVLAAGAAWAFTEPASGTLAYRIYDVAVNQILQGPIGYVGGLGLVGMGLYSAVMGQGGAGRAILCLLSGGALAGANVITNSLGFLM
jgi:hypothetical protein